MVGASPSARWAVREGSVTPRWRGFAWSLPFQCRDVLLRPSWCGRVINAAPTVTIPVEDGWAPQAVVWVLLRRSAAVRQRRTASSISLRSTNSARSPHPNGPPMNEPARSRLASVSAMDFRGGWPVDVRIVAYEPPCRGIEGPAQPASGRYNLVPRRAGRNARFSGLTGVATDEPASQAQPDRACRASSSTHRHQVRQDPPVSACRVSPHSRRASRHRVGAVVVLT